MTREQLLYISLYDNYNSRLGFKISDWLKARDMFRANKKEKEALLADSDRLGKLRKQVRGV